MLAAKRTILFGRKPAATYINSAVAQWSGATGSFSIPSGAQAGDLMIVASTNNVGNTFMTLTARGSGSALTQVRGDAWPGQAYIARIWSITLSAADVADGNIDYTLASSTGNYGAEVLVYRGATVCAYRSSGSDGGTGTINLTGFAPDPATKGVVITTAARSNSGTGPAVPSGFTARAATTTTNIRYTAFDRLGGYTNATVSLATFGGSSHFEAFAYLLELT